MKKIFQICFIAFIIPISILSQDLKNLDKKNGFKTIKLNNKLSKYSSEVKLIHNDESVNMSLYRYIPSDNDLKFIFNTKMDDILLYFSNDKKELLSIMFRKKYSPNDSNHYQNAVDELESNINNLTLLFGKPSYVINKKGDVDELGVAWKADNVELLIYVSYEGMKNGSNLYLTILKNTFTDNVLNNGF